MLQNKTGRETEANWAALLQVMVPRGGRLFLMSQPPHQPCLPAGSSGKTQPSARILAQTAPEPSQSKAVTTAYQEENNHRVSASGKTKPEV